MALYYASGEPVIKGDRVRYGSGEGIVELVAEPGVADPEAEYFVDEFGGGCLLITERLGRVFVDATSIAENVELVARA
jgi:hypothetical protein